MTREQRKDDIADEIKALAFELTQAAGSIQETDGHRECLAISARIQARASELLTNAMLMRNLYMQPELEIQADAQP